MLFLFYDSTAAIEWFFLFLVNFRVLLSFLNAREKTCGQWKRQAKVRYNSWEIRAGKICKTNFGKISAQPHTTLCILLLNRENNDKNNTFPLGKQICFTIVWGCAETLPKFYAKWSPNRSSGITFFTTQDRKKKIYELVFSERYMLLWVIWEIPVPLILFRWLVLHWWRATCNELTC